MANPRPTKRQRPDPGTSYHDPVPLINDDFDTIHSREGRLKRVGGGIRTAALPRDPLPGASWNSVHSWDPPDDPEFALDPNGDLYDDLVEADIMNPEEPSSSNPSKKKRSKVSKRPHVVWMELHRQTYLDEMVRWAGRADSGDTDKCPDCVARSSTTFGAPEYRCEDCFQPDLTCAACCVRRHRGHPFHRIEKWSGSQFLKSSLKALGLKVQLNHASMHCANPVPCHSSMLVLHTNGVHEVAIQYCGCQRALPPHIQLLRRRLYPSSQLAVKTCTTFELLRHLHELALTTKASTYDFYRALEKSTTNLGIDVPKSRYRALFRSILQWRHLKMLKWGGRAHDPGGVAETKAGELAIRCPSCPWPGINMVDGWENAPDGMKFLYMFFLCMDANFRLKNQLVSNYSQDPGLGIGWSYMVPRIPYERYVLSRASDEDISTCVGFQALSQANTRFSVGLRYTGVNAVVCGRSEMIMPQGVGNLQKGERYPNMDYIFGIVLRIVMVHLLLISYDIACQWFINLFKRMEEHWPDEIKPTRPIKLIPAIPKLHEPMHGATGHQVYSLNYIPGVGHSDCECPERVWAPHNALGNSTKTQGPGSRHDVLDDHFGFWNWQKYIGLGATLLRKYKAALADRNIQVEGHRGLTDSLDPDLVNKWEKMCIDWEEDNFPKTKKNPYHIDNVAISEAQVKKELADEEEKRLAAGGISPHNTSAASFVALGLEIEDAQRRIRRRAKDASSHLTFAKEGGLTEQRNMLRTRLRAWEQLLPIYMPGLLQYETDLASGNSPASTSPNQSPHPEDGVVWLPSRIAAKDRARVCWPGLAQMEERLRSGQCRDALESVRQVLRLKSRMVEFKNKQVRGQREGLRSRAVIDRVHERARAAAEKYRAARKAIYDLEGPGDWEEVFKILEDGDIRGYQDPNRLRPRKGRRGIWEDGQEPQAAPSTEDDGDITLYNEVRSKRDGTGETRRTLSWIWTTSRAASSDDDADDILRLEWAKSRARAARAREEVMLLKEEMNRVLKYLEWKSEWWRQRAGARTDLNKYLTEGIRAYAQDQADVQAALRVHFRKLWETPLQTSVEDVVGDDDDSDSDDSEGEEDADVDEDDDPMLQ